MGDPKAAPVRDLRFFFLGSCRSQQPPVWYLWSKEWGEITAIELKTSVNHAGRLRPRFSDGPIEVQWGKINLLIIAHATEGALDRAGFRGGGRLADKAAWKHRWGSFGAVFAPAPTGRGCP